MKNFNGSKIFNLRRNDETQNSKSGFKKDTVTTSNSNIAAISSVFGKVKDRNNKGASTNSLILGINRFNEILSETAQKGPQKSSLLKIKDGDYAAIAQLSELNYLDVVDEICCYI